MIFQDMTFNDIDNFEHASDEYPPMNIDFIFGLQNILCSVYC